jgi:hypothetical protein
MVAYALLQLDRLRSSAISFSLINALGALLIMLSLVFNFNLSAFLMEFFWFVISLFGAIRRMASNDSPAR